FGFAPTAAECTPPGTGRPMSYDQGARRAAPIIGCSCHREAGSAWRGFVSGNAATVPDVDGLVAVIGAGPAGIYAAQTLAQHGAHVALVNRDIKPGGLAEYGIFPTKHRMKEGLRKQFRTILDSQRIEYFGNLTVGAHADLTLDDLRAAGCDAILVTVGAQG